MFLHYLHVPYKFLYIQAGGLTRLPLHVSAPADFECLGLISDDQKRIRYFHEKFILDRVKF